MTTGKYDQGLSRQYPGLFVILLDQSASMTEEVAGTGQRKMDIATRHVNTIIKEMIDLAGVDEFTAERKKYAYLCVLGYNDSVYPLLSNVDTPVGIPMLAKNRRGMAEVSYPVKNANGDTVRMEKKMQPFWINAVADKNTQMAIALKRARQVVERWLNAPSELISDDLGKQMPREMSFPPVVLNITDAMHNGQGEPLEAAEQLRSLHTNNGNVLLFNCHFAKQKTQPYCFPVEVNEVEHFDEHRLAESMFYMSSVIPEPLRERGIKLMRTPIRAGARAFVYNADPDVLIQFLRWGTRANVATEDRR